MYNQNQISSISVASGGGLGSLQTYEQMPTPTAKRRVLADELQHLAEAIREAHKLTAQLEAVISPILSAVPPQPGNGSDSAPQSNNVVMIVAEQARWLYELNSRLNSILQRVEL